MRKWMKLHDSMCGSVCVREREGSGHRTKASLWVIGTTFFTLPSLSLSHIHSLFQSPYHSETLKLLRKILRYGHSYSECAQFQFRFSLSTPSVYTHTHTHTSLSMSPSGLTSSLNLDISSMCPPTTWDHLVRSESLWEVEQLSHLCPPP